MPDQEPSADLQDEIELQKALLPWWRKPIPVAVVTAILAAIAPTTTAVSAHYQKSRELALQASKQRQDALMEQLKLNHSIQMDYLQHMGDDIERARTLRMIIALNDDTRLIKWAKEEKAAVDVGAAKLKQQIDEQTALVSREHSAREAAEKKAGQLLTDTQSKQAEISQLKSAVSVAQCKALLANCVAEYKKMKPTESGHIGHPNLAIRRECDFHEDECVTLAVWPSDWKQL